MDTTLDMQPVLPPMRRTVCGYVLDHLETSQCPECGQHFDANDPATWTRKLPRIAWKLWLPGLLLALGSGLLATALLSSEIGWGWAATIAVPVSMGMLLGYGVRAGAWVGILLAALMITGFLGGLYFTGMVGAVCFSIFGAIAIFPIMVGWVAGFALRKGLKDTRWSQASHLPVLAGAVLLPCMITVVEGPVRAGPVASVATSIDLTIPADVAFSAWQFYEDVPRDQPKP